MALSDAVYVGRPDAINLEPNGRNVVDLDEALAAAASDATEITILGGYYDHVWLLDLFRKLPRARRRDCRVRIAVGSDATITLPKVWEHMRGGASKNCDRSVTARSRSPLSDGRLSTSTPSFFVSYGPPVPIGSSVRQIPAATATS